MGVIANETMSILLLCMKNKNIELSDMHKF